MRPRPAASMSGRPSAYVPIGWYGVGPNAAAFRWACSIGRRAGCSAGRCRGTPGRCDASGSWGRSRRRSAPGPASSERAAARVSPCRRPVPPSGAGSASSSKAASDSPRWGKPPPISERQPGNASCMTPSRVAQKVGLNRSRVRPPPGRGIHSGYRRSIRCRNGARVLRSSCRQGRIASCPIGLA